MVTWKIVLTVVESSVVPPSTADLTRCTFLAMSDESLVLPEALLAEAPHVFTPGEKRLRWFELLLVLLVAFSGYFLTSLTILKGSL
jgi:hypothetical protein